MKCAKCGSNLEIDMAFCPYCGASNPVAEKHRADMAKYSKDYEKTKEEVIGNSKRFNTKTLKITVLAVTIAAVAATIILCIFMVDRGGRYSWKYIKKDPEKEAMVKELVAECDYIGLYDYFESEHFRFDYGTENTDYNDLMRISTLYNELYVEILRTKQPMINFNDVSGNITSKIISINNYCKWKYKKEDITYFLSSMKRDMGLMLETYLGLSREQVESLDSLSDANLGLLIEEALSDVIEK